MEIGPAEVFRTRKDVLRWMAANQCKHGRNYLSHYHCYVSEGREIKERIGFLDIEASNLKANFGIMLSYCIKDQGGKIYSRVITPEELKSTNHDKNLTASCVADIQKFDRIVGFYSSGYDVPFIRSRAMAHGLQFPKRGVIKHTDIWFWVRGKLKLHSNRLQHACDFLDIPSKGHKLNGGMWTKALTGDVKSLNYILTHNKEDVVATEMLYDKLLPFCTLTGVSL
jgi:uncharacterized protein YprB with RNaseH-like and TPR domain